MRSPTRWPRAPSLRRSPPSSPLTSDNQPSQGDTNMSPNNEPTGRTTIVVGASRGLGRGIATVFAQAGDAVVAVARTAAPLTELADSAGKIKPEVADASDPTVAGVLLDRYDPKTLILVAGARPLMRPLQHQTWETFSVNWHTDVRVAFHWL